MRLLRIWFFVAFVVMAVYITHTRSVAAAPARKAHALARGFLVQVETDRKHILVAAPVANRAKAIAALLETHRTHERLTRVHCHHASRSVAVACTFLLNECYLRDVAVHRAANSARHRAWAYATDSGEDAFSNVDQTVPVPLLAAFLGARRLANRRDLMPLPLLWCRRLPLLW